MKFQLGLFERPFVDAQAVRPSTARERALAREAARSSIVLLENDGTLPLRDDLRTIAVIGVTGALTVVRNRSRYFTDVTVD